MNKFLILPAILLLLISTAPAATQVNIQGPLGSGEFGHSVIVLPNGNFVVTDPSFDQVNPPVANIGAVYLFSPEGAPISTLYGSNTDDKVGLLGVQVLANGNFVVRSPNWNLNRGAATWGSAVTGFIGGGSVVISAANSLVGSVPNDIVSNSSVFPLTNGHYVVCSSNWDNPAPTASNAGAVTWGNGFTGTTGVISAANSLVGTSIGDNLGIGGVTILSNGNYVISSSNWDNTDLAAVDAGAATWGNGNTGITGPVTASNSLVGTTTNDQVSKFGITPLNNGHYVVRSFQWDNPAPSTVDAGAITWGNGTTGISGFVTAANSLIGTSPGDQLGTNGIIALTNGHYVVCSSNWDNPAPAVGDAGAVTWGNGSTGVSGPITAVNSLIGTSPGDQVGSSSVTALTNGHYVVSSPNWDNTSPAVSNAGAATWANGTTGISGVITAANSLIGTTANDQVGGSGVTALTNGHYVVRSPNWDRTAPAVSNVGAATWVNGFSGLTGPVTATNSLVGTTSNDQVGSAGVTALTNGHYVVRSPNWDSTASTVTNAGAATWGNGTTGIKGPVTIANSLFGTTANDQVGGTGVTALSNGNYVVRSSNWDNPDPAVSNVGAVTWSSGNFGITGPVTVVNSLVGTSSGDSVGDLFISGEANGNYRVRSSNWDNTAPAAVDAGAVSLGNGATGTAGRVSSANSVLGTVASTGFVMDSSYDPVRHQLIVGRRESNLVTRFLGDRLRSLAVTGLSAPGALDIAYAKVGTAAVNIEGKVLTDFTLTGSGSKGKNRAFFSFSPIAAPDLVLQSGTPLSTLGGNLPDNAVATALHSQIFHQPNRSVFQATVKGTGISTTNNRLLLLDNGVGIQLLHRSGSPVPPLGGSSLSTFKEVIQSHNEDFIALTYKLQSGNGVTSANDEGLLFLDHIGTVGANLSAREGQPAYDGGGDFGAFTGRASASLGNNIHFTSFFKPTGGKPIPAVFSTSRDGVTTTRLAKAGDPAPASGGAAFNAFPAISQLGISALVKATLKGSPATQNEGLYRLPASGLLTRKGDPIGGGLNIARLLRFWPAGPDQVILHLQVTGLGVSGSNNQVLALRQSDAAYMILLRTGTHSPGTLPATVKSISAVDVNPVTGRYAILATLNGSPTNANQALWTGDPTLGNNTPALQVLRLPQLTLRKGNPYSTESTPSSSIRSIALKPAIDPTGAGGRGLSQAIGASDDLALFITTDRNLTELVLLDR